MPSNIKRIGVLTGGGDCPGLNAVIRAVAKSAMHRYGLEVWGIEDGFLGMIQNRMRPLAWADVSNILTLGGTILGTTNKTDPSAYPVRRGDKVANEDVTHRMLEHLTANQIDAVVAIGGDGTMTGMTGLIKHGVRCGGVPKTIDNDIEGCDLTFGFDTAVQTATDCLDKIHTTAMSHHRAMLVEVMGRNAGWLALQSGIAGGADVILIPEVPFETDHIARVLAERRRTGKKFSIIVVSEGAKPLGGEVTIARRVEGSPDPIRLGGISTVLANQIEDATGIETRATILGHIQRGGTPSAFDRVLATMYGYHALELLMGGNFGHMVVWHAGQVKQVSILEIANKQRKVPADHRLVQTARSVGTSFGDAVEVAENTTRGL